MEKTISKSYNVTINADLFIIPNSAVRGIDGYLEPFRDKNEKWLSNICEASGVEFNRDDFIIETWMVGMSNGMAENMSDHYSCITIDDKMYRFRFCNRFLPMRLIDGKEGEVVKIVIPGIELVGEDDNIILMDLHINCRLNQHDYRYARFGQFEEVLQKVCRS